MNSALIQEAIEASRVELASAEADIKTANDTHRATMERVQAMVVEADAVHRTALSDAMSRKLRAEGAIAVLEKMGSDPRRRSED